MKKNMKRSIIIASACLLLAILVFTLPSKHKDNPNAIQTSSKSNRSIPTKQPFAQSTQAYIPQQADTSQHSVTPNDNQMSQQQNTANPSPIPQQHTGTNQPIVITAQVIPEARITYYWDYANTRANSNSVHIAVGQVGYPVVQISPANFWALGTDGNWYKMFSDSFSRTPLGIANIKDYEYAEGDINCSMHKGINIKNVYMFITGNYNTININDTLPKRTTDVIPGRQFYEYLPQRDKDTGLATQRRNFGGAAYPSNTEQGRIEREKRISQAAIDAAIQIQKSKDQR